MSRELLKRAVRFMSVVGCSNDDICELCDEIETYLAQPDEPVAFVMDEKSYNAVGYDKRMGRIIWRRQPAFGAELYEFPPDQSARIAELAADGVRLMETITELRSQLVTPNWENNRIAMQVGEIKELKQQLAALQVKREPLSDDEIMKCIEGDGFNFRGYNEEFILAAKAIEEAHGITGG